MIYSEWCFISLSSGNELGGVMGCGGGGGEIVTYQPALPATRGLVLTKCSIVFIENIHFFNHLAFRPFTSKLT